MIQNHETTSQIRDHAQQYYQCEHCNKSIKGGENLERHVRGYHKIKLHKCTQCSYKTNRAYNLIKHKLVHMVKANSPQINSPSEPPNHDDEAVRSAFNGKMQERAWFIRGSTDPLGALRDYKNRIRDALFLSLKKNPQKFYIAVKVRFFKKE